MRRLLRTWWRWPLEAHARLLFRAGLVGCLVLVVPLLAAADPPAVYAGLAYVAFCSLLVGGMVQVSLGMDQGPAPLE